MHPGAPQAAFAAGACALSLPVSELATMRGLLPARTVSRQALGALLGRLRLPDPGLADALFALADLRNAGVVRAQDLLATYAALRRAATSSAPDAADAACGLAFLSAGAGADAVTWTDWLALAGEFGLGVGGVDCLPDESVAAVMRKRWRAACGRVRSLITPGERGISYASFLEVMHADDAGLLEGLKAVGFVLVHAVIDHAKLPVEKPVWRGETDSCYLSQYMSYAIASANERAGASSKLLDRPEADHAEGEESKRHESAKEPCAGVEVGSSLSDDAAIVNVLRANDLCKDPEQTELTSKPKASLMPDTEGNGNGNHPSSLPNIATRPRARITGLPRGWRPDAQRQPKLPAAKKGKPAPNLVSRTQNCKASSSPFHIDFSSLELGERIGSGAYGDVYRGTFLMSPVAVKMFHVNVSISPTQGPRPLADDKITSNHNDDPGQMSRMMSMSALQRFVSESSKTKYRDFVREVEMMSVVRHPNLVLYMGACGDPVTPLCIVSELFTGGSLHEFLHADAGFRPGTRTALSFGVNIARGMFYLHSSQPSIVHRDLKARNVLLSGRRGEDGVPHVVICDFGLSQLFGEEGGSGAGATNAMGTAAYMAPDVINGGKYEAADDVYSYGVLLHEIFTGCMPYAGLRAMQVMYGVANDELRPKSRLDVHIPGEVRALIESCWAAKRSDRPTFDGVIERLIEIDQTRSTFR